MNALSHVTTPTDRDARPGVLIGGRRVCPRRAIHSLQPVELAAQDDLRVLEDLMPHIV